MKSDFQKTESKPTKNTSSLLVIIVDKRLKSSMKVLKTLKLILMKYKMECNHLLGEVEVLQNESSDSESVKQKLTKTLELQKQLDQARNRGKRR